MRSSLKRIINYDKDLPFKEFAELVGQNTDYISEVFLIKLGKVPKLSEKIDFDTASLLIEDIDRKCSCGPLITRTILKRGKLRSPKTLQQITVGDKIAIDVYPFDYHNRTLECVSKMCSDYSVSGLDLDFGGGFKVFQMKDPEKIFIIKDDFYYIEFKYYGGCYHLDEPLKHLRLLNNRELTDDFLKDLEKEMGELDKYNELINYIIAHKDEYVLPKGGERSDNIDWIVSDLKNGKTSIHVSEYPCNKCGKPLLSVFCKTGGINYNTYDVLICPNCKIDYGIDFSTLTSVIV